MQCAFKNAHSCIKLKENDAQLSATTHNQREIYKNILLDVCVWLAENELTSITWEQKRSEQTGKRTQAQNAQKHERKTTKNNYYKW